VFVAGLFITALVIKIRRDWMWTEFGKQMLAMLILAAFFGACVLAFWLVKKWYEWAKNYSRDC
jgi:hypothetical protein